MKNLTFNDCLTYVTFGLVTTLCGWLINFAYQDYQYRNNPVSNKAPTANYKHKLKNAGWIMPNNIKIGKDGYAWSDRAWHSGELKMYDHNSNLNDEVFLVIKEDRWEVYLPKENKDYCWKTEEGFSKNISVEIIPTDVPSEAFQDAIYMGLMEDDIANLVKEYTSSTTLVAEKD